MRASTIALLTLLSLGCSETYLVQRRAPVDAAGYVPATRERDGQPMLVRKDNLEPTGAGNSQVRRLVGKRRSRAMWQAGTVITVVGAALSIVGLGMGVDWRSQTPLLLPAIIIGPIGDALGMIVGPALMGAGGRRTSVDGIALERAHSPSATQAWMPVVRNSLADARATQ